MKLKNRNSFLLALVLFLFSTSIYARDFFPVMGEVSTVRGNKIIVNDAVYIMLPTLKVILQSKKSGKLSDIKKGQLVGMKLVTINDRQRVDTIQVLPGVSQR